MPLCSYQQAPDRNDRTVVENIFLREFMPAAPEGAVKAYLYGLMQCQQGTGAGSLSAFARAVALSETEVQDAFAYWQEKAWCWCRQSRCLPCFIWISTTPCRRTAACTPIPNTTARSRRCLPPRPSSLPSWPAYTIGRMCF